MPDYSKGKIYCIRSFQTDDVYIGSTIQTLAQRLGKHRYQYKNYLNGNGDYYTSYKILKYGDHYIELITLFPCSCKSELVAEEGQYIREWDCVNKYIPGRTIKQYYIDNRDKKLEYQKQRYFDNRDKKLEYQKQRYFDNKPQLQKYYNQKLYCICSCKISRRNIRRHIKSKKHKNFMSEFIKNFISQ